MLRKTWEAVGPALVMTLGLAFPAHAQTPQGDPIAEAIEDAASGALTMEAVNAAEFVEGEQAPEVKGKPDPLILKTQVLLDRAHASPGVIDGLKGENVEKAIRAFETMQGLEADGALDAEVWKRLTGNAGPVLVEHTITEEDLSGPFVEAIPADYSEMAEMERLAYTSPEEMFAERFHMDIDLLKALNPDADFSKPGTRIIVADPGEPASAKVARLVADKATGQLLGHDAEDRLVVGYPATIGSEETPSPSGTHEVTAIAPNPTYTYDPEVNFQQGDNTEKLTLPPGPNGPVGSMWIDLSEPTYGIHGTPEPSKIDKTRSHGCVRLTNWDAEELARLVEKGVPVEFRD